MKAVYLVRFGKPEEAFEIRDVPIPECGENQVRIKVEAFGLNFADVTCTQRKIP
jgi:NADPH2:quinone reductase